MLKLLGIYRKRGLHQEFQETAEKLRKNFNIQAEDWSAAGNGEAPTLEKFSRVSQHVQSIWTQPEECIDYLRHLIEDNRDGARAGFPQSVAEEILLLVEILKETSDAVQGPA
jgi:pilus assembly protein FimV